MASKLERERMALETAETELKERRRNLVKLEREETGKAISQGGQKDRSEERARDYGNGAKARSKKGQGTTLRTTRLQADEPML